jgi:hypothetical protein
MARISRPNHLTGIIYVSHISRPNHLTGLIYVSHISYITHLSHLSRLAHLSYLTHLLSGKSDLKEVQVVLLPNAGDLPDLRLIPRATFDKVCGDGDRHFHTHLTPLAHLNHPTQITPLTQISHLTHIFSEKSDLEEVQVVLLPDAGDLPDLCLLPRAAVDEVSGDGDRQFRVQTSPVEALDRDLTAGRDDQEVELKV